ncbi:MAG: hypothetical protein ACKVX7_12760 [Planctomycetota bacterium]
MQKIRVLSRYLAASLALNACTAIATPPDTKPDSPEPPAQIERPAQNAAPAENLPAIELKLAPLPPGPELDLKTLRLPLVGMKPGETLELRIDPPPVETGGDEQLAEWIAAQFEAINSTDLRAVPTTGRELALVHARVDLVFQSALTHAEKYPASPWHAQVVLAIARLATLNIERFLGAETNRKKQMFNVNLEVDEQLDLVLQYYRPIVRIVSEALKLNPDASTRVRLLSVLAHCYLRVGNHHHNILHLGADGLRYQAQAADLFEAALRINREHPDAAENHISLCVALLDSRQFGRTVTACEDYLQRYARQKYAINMFIYIHKALQRSGQVEAGLALWNRFAPILEAGSKGLPMPTNFDGGGWIASTESRPFFESYRAQLDFYRFYYTFALGDLVTAKTHLQTFLDHVLAKEASGALIDVQTKVHREQMAQTYEASFDRLLGKPAPSFDVEDGWVIPPPNDGEAAKATLLFFCNVGSARDRHHQLFEVFEKLKKEFFERGLRIVWLTPGSLRRDATAEEQKSELAHAAKILGMTSPTGIDLRVESPVWSAYGANKLGVQVFLINEKNAVCWQLIDPMAWEEGFLRYVIGRVLDKK